MSDETTTNGNFLVNNEWKRKNPEDSGYLTATPESIEETEQSVHNDNIYGRNGTELEHYLGAHSSNCDHDAVIHKILLIDYTNSTNLRLYRKKGTTVFSLADQIVAHSRELDQMIQSGAPEAVRLIAGFGTVNLFSFATKYCCYHNTLCYGRDDYSIYDNIVADVIPGYLDVKRFFISRCRVEQNYLEYKRIVDTLITVHGLQSVPQIRRKLDHFLWYSNKDKKKSEQ